VDIGRLAKIIVWSEKTTCDAVSVQAKTYTTDGLRMQSGQTCSRALGETDIGLMAMDVAGDVADLLLLPHGCEEGPASYPVGGARVSDGCNDLANEGLRQQADKAGCLPRATPSNAQAPVPQLLKLSRFRALRPRRSFRRCGPAQCIVPIRAC